MAFALLSSGVARAEPHVTTPVVFDRIVAVVEGEPILLSALRRRAAPFLHPTPGVPGLRRQRALRKLYRGLMKRLIEERLVERAARDAGISMDRAAVDRTLALVAVHNHMKRAELLARVRAAGMTEQEYRAELQRQLVESQLLYAFMRKHHVRIDGEDDTARAHIMERERRRWMAGLYGHASIQQYFRP